MTVHSFEAGGKRPAVLVVEDEVLIRLDLSDHLRDYGFDVTEAGDADEALAWLSRKELDAVVTDVRMPGTIDGIQLAHKLNREHPHIAVIVVSGHADAAQAPLGVPVIAKPFNVRELVALVHARLKVNS